MANPFARKVSKRSIFDTFAVSLLRGLTYALLIAGGAIFANIIWKGIPVLGDRGLDYVLAPQVPSALHEFTDANGTPRRLSDADKRLYDLVIKNKEAQNALLGEEKIQDPKKLLNDLPALSRNLGAFTQSGLAVESNLQSTASSLQQVAQLLEKATLSDEITQGLNIPELVSALQDKAQLLQAADGQSLENQFAILQEHASAVDELVHRLDGPLGNLPDAIQTAKAEAEKLIPELEQTVQEVQTSKREALIENKEELKDEVGGYREKLEPLAGVEDLRPEDLVKAWELASKNSQRMVELDENYSLSRAMRERVRKVRETEKLLARDGMREAVKMAIAGDGEPLAGLKTVQLSAGSLLGPIIGTVLLVVTCVIIALLLGVAAAIYLSEYAEETTAPPSWLTVLVVGFMIGLVIWGVVAWVLPPTAGATTTLISRLVLLGLILPFSRYLIQHWVEIVRLAIINLAGVPSIVFGIFGFALFVLAGPKITANPGENAEIYAPLFGDWVIIKGWGPSVLAGAVTLAFMILPVVIVAAEEALRAVPKGFREASLALGASKWETIRKSVLPFATPGILTSSVLAITRVAGETAPILFTAAVISRDVLPWQDGVNTDRGAWALGGWNPIAWLDQPVMALPYHVYFLSKKLPDTPIAEESKYASVIVFIALVFALALASVLLRIRLRSKLKW